MSLLKTHYSFFLPLQIADDLVARPEKVWRKSVFAMYSYLAIVISDSIRADVRSTALLSIARAYFTRMESPFMTSSAANHRRGRNIGPVVLRAL